MISEANIAIALGQRLEGLYLSPDLCQRLGCSLPLPIGWENKDLPTETPWPFLVFEVVRVTRRSMTLARGITMSTGFVMVTVMTRANTFATDGLEIAEAVAALFPFTLRIPLVEGEISITRPPEILQGRPDDPHYRTPVRIPYEAS